MKSNLKALTLAPLAAALFMFPAALAAQEAGDPTGGGIGIIGQPAPVVQPVDDDEADAKAPLDRIKFLLSGYEYFPTRADLDEVGSASEVSTLLRELAAMDDLRPTMRLRAVDALAYYTDEATRSYLEALIEGPATKAKDKVSRRTRKLMRHHAVTSLAKAHEEKALATIEPLLMSEDIQLKMTAISAVGKHTGPRGKERLERLAETITNPVVKRELRKFVTL